jgi:hypothetical protein
MVKRNVVARAFPAAVAARMLGGTSKTAARSAPLVPLIGEIAGTIDYVLRTMNATPTRMWSSSAEPSR